MAESTETTVARLDERFKGLQSAIEQMVEDQRSMAASYEKLVESNQRVALLEADALTTKASIAKLWEKADATEKERAKGAQKWFWELARAIIAAGFAIILFKAGIHS